MAFRTLGPFREAGRKNVTKQTTKMSIMSYMSETQPTVTKSPGELKYKLMSEICCLKCREMINDAQSKKKVCFREGLLIISKCCQVSSCPIVTTGVTISNVSLSTYFAMTIMSQLLDIIYVRQLKAYVEPRTLYIRLETFPSF